MSEEDTKFILLFTNDCGEKFFFVSLGDCWPHKPELRLIKETTARRDRATRFDTVPDALDTIIQAGDPQGWQVVAG